MELKINIEKILTELNKIGSTKAAKEAKTEIETILNKIEDSWKLEITSLQNTIISLQNKVILNQEDYIEKLETLIKKASNEEKKYEEKSYAMVVREKSHPIPKANFALLISSNNDKPADEIEKILKDKIKVSKLGIGISGLKKTYQNKIILTCEKQNDTEKIVNEINKNPDIGIHANEIKKKKPCIMMKGVDAYYNEKELIIDLINQNEDIKNAMTTETDNEPIIVKKKLKNKKSDKLSNFIIQTTPKLRKIIISKERINIGYTKAHVEDCDPLMQCYHCLGYGHTSLRCLENMKSPRCLHCAGEHKIQDCPKKQEPAKCHNCTNRKGYQNEHPGNSYLCEFRKKMLKNAQMRIEYE